MSAASLRQLAEMGRTLDQQMVRFQRALKVAGVNGAFAVGRLKHKDMQVRLHPFKGKVEKMY